MLRDPRIEITLEVLAMLVPFVPGFLISWLILHWHGIAVIAFTIGTGGLLIWAFVKFVHWLGARQRRRTHFVCGFPPFPLYEKEKEPTFWEKKLEDQGLN